MKRFFVLTVAVGLLVGAVALSGNNQKAPVGDFQVEVAERNPWTHLRINDAPESFHFAIVSDRTGGHRARVFSEAVDRLNLMQPSFVVSVGDLIEGYTKDKAKLASEWKEFQSYAHRLEMPFFYVPGNHDVSNSLQGEFWQNRFGRRYYHFLYRNVLFLMLNSDDPDQEKGKEKFSPEQIDYVKSALQDNKTASWTMVFMHKPMWQYGDVEKSGWLEIEKMLADRPYTVFAGHVHRYHKAVRQGRNYYQLATTGGGSKLRGLEYGEFDHLVWITMKKSGPVMSNLLLDGIYPENLKPAISPEEGYVRYNLKPVVPVEGRIALDGAPLPGALVELHVVDAKSKKSSRVADALVRADGTFVLSTNAAFDGAPPGQYVVTVVQPDPRYDTSGKAGPNKLPTKYASPATSDLSTQIKAGEPNHLELSLSR